MRALLPSLVLLLAACEREEQPPSPCGILHGAVLGYHATREEQEKECAEAKPRMEERAKQRRKEKEDAWVKQQRKEKAEKVDEGLQR